MDIGKMDMDGTGLADTIEPANSLLHELGIFREVPKDEVVGKLEVAPFASDLGTEEYAGTFGIGKVGGLAVALDEVEPFVKLAEVEVNLFLYGLINFFDEGAGLANEQDFFLRMCKQPVYQPFDLLFEVGVVIGSGIERMKNGLALGETF